MKSRVKFINTVYNVNEQDKTVECTIDCAIDLTKFSFWRYLNKILSSEFLDINNKYYVFGANTVNKIINKYNADKGIINFTISTHTTCGDNDVFDETVGKHIAFTRAQEKAFKQASIIYTKISDAIYKDITNDLFIMSEGCIFNAFNTKQHAIQLEAKSNAHIDSYDEYVEKNFMHLFE